MKEAYPDHTQFEKNNPHYDSSSKEDNPKWSMKLLFFPAHGGQRVEALGSLGQGTEPRRWGEGRPSSLGRSDRRGQPARRAFYTQLTQLDCLLPRAPLPCGRTVCADDEAAIPLAELRAHHQAHKASGGPLKTWLSSLTRDFPIQR